MYESVKAAFTPFSTGFEGYLPWMYADQKNLITTGMGNLIDPVENALALPWTHGVNGPPATPEEIMAAFRKVKASDSAGKGGGTQGDLTDLRLNEDGIQALIAHKLTNNEATLRQYVPQWDSLPADAQLGLLSMAWALGPAFFPSYPHFTAALNAAVPDFQTVALQSWMRDSKDWVPSSLQDDPSKHPPNTNAGLRPRNLANRQLFLNAGNAVAKGLDPEELVWDVAKGLRQLGAYALSTAATVGTAAASVATNRYVLAGAAALFAGGMLGIAKTTGELKKVAPGFDRLLDRMTGIGPAKGR
jgi:hypothetical protein